MLADLLALAFQTDSTRIATFVFANEGSNRPYPFLEVREGHHDLSHHQNDPVKQAKLATINRFHVTQLAYLLGKLKAVREGDGTLLDHCMIVYGSGIATAIATTTTICRSCSPARRATRSTPAGTCAIGQHAAQQPLAGDARSHGLVGRFAGDSTGRLPNLT